MSFSWLKLRNAIRMGEELIPEVSVATPPNGEVKVEPATEPLIDKHTGILVPIPKTHAPVAPSEDPQDTLEQAAADSRKYLAQVRPLLDLIGKTEGTAKARGYNETLGYGAYTGGDKELVKMILPSIDALQTSMLNHPRNTMNSSALGMYQVVRTTLRALKKKWDFSDNQLFDPLFQDDLAYILLVGRGLVRWRKGEISTAAFIDAISKEWASLPNSKGRGSYHGQGIGCTLEQLRDVVLSIR